jgi:hypothetical protein
MLAASASYPARISVVGRHLRNCSRSEDNKSGVLALSSRNLFIALIAVIALGTGAWLILYGGHPQDGRGAQELSTAGSPREEFGVAPSAPQIAANVTTNSSGNNPDETPRSEEAPLAPVPWPAATLAFTDQPDTDPGLSKELEASLQRSMDQLLDKSRFDLQSVTCRSSSCQILTIDRTPEPEKGWPVVLVAMRNQLKDGFVRHPSTGVSLQPKVEILQPVPAEEYFGFITVISFEDQTLAHD